MIYAGIGPRKTPAPVCQDMARAAQTLGKLGWTLHSGGARGADQAFQRGSEKAKGKQQIFYANDCTKEARAMAGKYHPNWAFVVPHARDLLGRNCMIMLGENLETPVDFVLTWYPDNAGGGTQHALKIADDHDIPVFNMNTMPLDFISGEVLRITERLTHARPNP